MLGLEDSEKELTYHQGYADGIKIGKELGYDKGYTEGYDRGLSELIQKESYKEPDDTY